MTIREIAKERNLSVVTTRNGEEYLTGFDSWEDVENLCKDFYSELQTAEAVILYHKNGREWEREGYAYGAFNTDDEEILSRHHGFLLFDNDISECEFIKQEIFEVDPQSFDELIDLTNRKREMWEEIEQLPDNHVLVLDGSGNCEIVERDCLRDSYDVHNWLIAVEIDFPADEENDEAKVKV